MLGAQKKDPPKRVWEGGMSDIPGHRETSFAGPQLSPLGVTNRRRGAGGACHPMCKPPLTEKSAPVA